jgi:predicted ATPase
LTGENAPAIAEICIRLDGLPLAIELAATRVRFFTPESILARLDRRIEFLTGGAHDLPARQQTIRNTIAWSHDLLDDAEKTLFRRLAVFAGGFTAQAAAGVCNVDGDISGDIYDLLISLVTKGLLQQPSGGVREPRLIML